MTSRPPSRSTIRRPFAFAGGIALALVVLTGCSAGSESPSTTPPAIPEGPVAPIAAFDGDCNSIFTPAEIGDILGEPMAEPIAYASTPVPLTVAVEVVGGVGCSWAAETTGSGAGAFLDLVIVPQAAVPDAALQDPYCYGSSSGDVELNSCSFTDAADGYLLSAVAYVSAGGSEADAHVAADAIGVLFESKTENVGEPIEPGSVEGSWTGVPVCEDLNVAADIPTLLASPTIGAYQADGPAEAPPALFDIATAAGYFSCTWYYEDGETPADSVEPFVVTGLAGSAFVQPRVAALADAAPFELDGFDDSVVVGGTVLNVFDGSNWLALQSAANPQTAAALAAVTPAVGQLFTALTGR